MTVTSSCQCRNISSCVGEVSDLSRPILFLTHNQTVSSALGISRHSYVLPTGQEKVIHVGGNLPQPYCDLTATSCALSPGSPSSNEVDVRLQGGGLAPAYNSLTIRCAIL